MGSTVPLQQLRSQHGEDQCDCLFLLALCLIWIGAFHHISSVGYEHFIMFLHRTSISYLRFTGLRFSH